MNVEAARMYKIALIGNPNSGKTTLFNSLTGLRQKTGNFPGVTVDTHEGRIKISKTKEARLIDFPGTYSLYPISSDEKIVVSTLCNPEDTNYPDAILYVADVTNLEKHLLLFTQLIDLKIPLVLVLNMTDLAQEKQMKISTNKLSDRYKVPVISISGRTGENVTMVLFELERVLTQNSTQIPSFYPFTDTEKQVSEAVKQNMGIDNAYRALLMAHHREWLPFLTKTAKETLATIVETKGFNTVINQVNETLDRYDRFTNTAREAVVPSAYFKRTYTDRIDGVVTHRLWGPIIFFGVMLILFEALFDWSGYPMDAIENGFGWLNEGITESLGQSWWVSLITDGILSGLSGILVFVPQIALLFLIVTILEEVGYMSRVVFMFDKTMRKFGMNGRSVVALIGGSACAVPAIMSSRTIGNWKERIITTMVTPFISCSARIPVYLVLIGLAIPPDRIWGVANLQTLVFGSMYALGVIAALGAGWAMKKWLRTTEPSFLAIELPEYRVPHWKNVFHSVWNKVKAFVIGAGKIILIVSIALWALSNYGPSGSMKSADVKSKAMSVEMQLNSSDSTDLAKKYRLEASWAGLIGKKIEPLIRPLGYDWKIGIALITSFAAREVFTGTLAVLYNMDSAQSDISDRADNEGKLKLRDQMRKETFSDTNKPVYTFGTVLSLLVFYALAMQCMSTLAVVKRETGSWKWAAFQFLAMSIMAYLSAWAVYVLFT